MDTLHAPVPHPSVRHRLGFAVGFIATSLATGAARAQADPPARVGRVAEIAGDVRTIDPEGAWSALVRNQPLSTGDRVATDRNGQATLQFGSTVVRVGADSDVVVPRLDDQKIRLHFDHGRLAVRVRSDDIPGELFIETDADDLLTEEEEERRSRGRRARRNRSSMVMRNRRPRSGSSAATTGMSRPHWSSGS